MGYFLLLINFILVIYTFQEVISDISKNKLSLIIIPTIFFKIPLYIILPMIYLPGCFVANFCLSPYPDIESKLIYKGSLFFISFFTGIILGIKLYKSKRLNFIKRFLDFIPTKRLIFPPILSQGLYVTFVFFSISLLIYGLLNGDQYYNPTYGRIFSIYINFLIVPVFLLDIVKDRKKDLKLLSLSIFLYSLVLFFGIGRTSNFLFYFIFSSFIFIISLSPGLDFRESLKIILTKKSFLFLIGFFISLLIIVLRIKYIELEFAISAFPLMDDIFSSNIITCLKDNQCRQLIYTGTAALVGIPLYNITHMINSIDYERINILAYQFVQLVNLPIIGQAIIPPETLDWYRNLPSNILNIEITEFGGTTFGSDFAMYSYMNTYIATALLFLIPFSNIFIIYFLCSKIKLILDSFYKNNTQNNTSIRLYAYILLNISAGATIQSLLFHSIIHYLPFFFISKFFNKSINSNN